ncbi:TMEM175 family protein [Actinoplanes sp. URMC 104]|uniref:TMEM175 family protein n=1 Tax=Actinoplanes sp. URMC 104 TaxID=3423409 RepID=UPI003F1BB077
MPEPESEVTSERLVLFTDAVAALALTLLILPLLDVITDLSEGHPGLGDLVREHRGDFAAFLLSFAVIFRLWWAHHRIFQHLSLIRPRLVALSALWTLAIAFLPIPTAIITAYEPSAGSVALYGGALVLASGSLTLLSLYARRHPALSAGRTPVPAAVVVGNFAAFLAQVAATVIGAVFAGTVNFLAFLLMFLTTPLERAIRSRWK